MRVSEIRVYPVKGMRGRSVAEARLEPWGLAGDRRWMVVDERGRFLSQRELPALSLIEADLVDGGLSLAAPDGSRHHVDEPKASAAVDTVIWRDDVRAAASDPAADAWLSAALGRPCRLVFMADPAEARQVDPTFGAPSDRVSFADGFPLLVTTTASLDDLARRAAIPTLSMDRFRTNLVVDGAEPWAEDAWTEIRVGEAALAVVKPCARCVVTTVDQASGVKHPEAEPLRTLLTFRRDARGQPIFGQNLIPRTLGRIKVGDAVSVRGG